MKIKIYFSILFIVFSMLFQSCQKDTTSTLDNIPTYASFDDMSSMIHVGDGLSGDDKKSTSEYMLYMDLIEEKYNKIDTNIFADMSKLKSFVQENSDWLELECDANGEYTLIPKYSNTPFSSFMGEGRSFFVGQTMYKVYDEGLLYTNKEASRKKLINMNEIPIILDDDIHYIPNDVEFKPTGVLCKGVGRPIIDSRSTVERERIWFEQKVCLMNYNGVDIPVFAYKMRPYQKIAGIWYWCQRVMKAHVDVEFEVKYNHLKLCENPVTKEEVPSTTARVIEKTVTSSFPSSAILMISSNSWAETDRSGRAFIIFKY